MVSRIDGNALTAAGHTVASQAPVGLFGRDGASFKDVLDTVNPLQQLPIIGSLYRSETGDTIAPAAKIAGAALFGGPIGVAVAALDSVVEMVSGSSVADHALATASDAPPAPPMSQQAATAQAAEALAATAPAPEAPTEAPVSLVAQLEGRNALVYGRQQGAYAQHQAVEGAYQSALKELSV